jgi:hypothetical protein
VATDPGAEPQPAGGEQREPSASRGWNVAMVAAGILGAGLALIAAAFALFGFAISCSGSDVATPPREGTAGDALCSAGVYVWDPLLWVVLAGCACVAISASVARRSARPMALTWLGGVALLALSVALFQIVDAARDSV